MSLFSRSSSLSPTVYGKPILNTSSTPSPVPFLHGGVKAAEEEVPDGGKAGVEAGERQVAPPPNVDNIPRPLSPTKLTPVGRSLVLVLVLVLSEQISDFSILDPPQLTASCATRVTMTWRFSADASATPHDP